jgi:excisionase family DNA binding protein
MADCVTSSGVNCGTRIAFKPAWVPERPQLTIMEEEQVTKLEGSKVLTVKELSDYLKVHPSTIYRQLKRGRLPAFKVGSDWRFNVESIDRWRLDQDSVKVA